MRCRRQEKFVMKDRVFWFFIAVMIVIAVCELCMSACSSIPDNPVEEYAEELIENYTGLDVDLTSDDESTN